MKYSKIFEMHAAHENVYPFRAARSSQKVGTVGSYIMAQNIIYSTFCNAVGFCQIEPHRMDCANMIALLSLYRVLYYTHEQFAQNAIGPVHDNLVACTTQKENAVM